MLKVDNIILLRKFVVHNMVSRTKGVASEKESSLDKGRLFESSIGLMGGSMVYVVRWENC